MINKLIQIKWKILNKIVNYIRLKYVCKISMLKFIYKSSMLKFINKSYAN